MRAFYRALLLDYRGELDRFFLQNFYANLNANKEPAWDPVQAIQMNAVGQFTDSFDDLIDASLSPVADLLDEELVDGYEESHDHALWMLYLGGIDTTEDPDPIPSAGTIKGALVAAGVAGIGYPTRLEAWGNEVKGQFARQFRGSVIGGRTGRDTLDTFDALTTTFVGHVEGLAQNELYRAAGVGAGAALEPYRNQLVGEVWLTRRDTGVCPICLAKELTITHEQPITDSHPGCRCTKVPIPLDYRGQPIDYVAFLEQLGRR